MPKCEEHGHVYGDGCACPDCAATTQPTEQPDAETSGNILDSEEIDARPKSKRR